MISRSVSSLALMKVIKLKLACHPDVKNCDFLKLLGGGGGMLRRVVVAVVRVCTLVRVALSEAASAAVKAASTVVTAVSISSLQVHPRKAFTPWET